MSIPTQEEHSEITRFLAGLTRRLLAETRTLHKVAMLVEDLGRSGKSLDQGTSCDLYKECIRAVASCAANVKSQSKRLQTHIDSFDEEPKEGVPQNKDS